MKRNLLISLSASVISIVAIVGLLGMPPVAEAAVCTWTGTVDTDWANAGNWTGCGGVTPTLIDSIVINNTANQPIIYSGTNPSTLYALTLDSGASLRVSGTITFGGGTIAGLINVQPGGLVHIKGYSILSGTLAVQSGGKAHIEGQSSAETTLTGSGVLTGAGDLLITNASLGSYYGLAVYGQYALTGLLTLDNGTAAFYTPTLLPRVLLTNTYGSLSGGGKIVTVTQAMTWGGGPAGQLAIAPGATLRVDAPSGNTLYGNLTNYGTVNWLRGWLASGKVINQSSGVFNSQANGLFTESFDNYGTFNVLSGMLQAGSLYQYAGTTNLNGGNLAFNGITLNGGTLMGSGVITGSVTNYYGVVAPGHPLGALTIVGNYSQYPAGTLRIDLGGTTAGVNYDVLNVNGQAILNGTLIVSQTNGFLAMAGDSFRVANYTTLYLNIKFITTTNPIAATHPAVVNSDHVLIAEPAASTRLSKRPTQALSDRGTLNGYTLAAFNPTPLTVTVSIITDSLSAGFTYQPNSTTGATTAEPNIVTAFDGQQTLRWTGTYTLAPSNSITLGFGVLVSPTNYGTYSNTAAIRVDSTVSDTREVAVNNVAPIIVPLRVSDNTAIVVGGGMVQNTNPPQILIRRGLAGQVPITITASIICPFDSCGAIQHVFLAHGAISYTMHLVSGTLTAVNRPHGGKGSHYGFWEGTIPGEGVIPGVPIDLFPDWDDHHPCIAYGPGGAPEGCVPGDPSPGTPHLYDPSGFVTDAQTGLPISGATVTLYRVPSLLPDARSETHGCRTVNTRPGGVGGSWAGLPAANTSLGVFEYPLFAPAQIDPAVNPQLTDDAGHFGWNVMTGCWYVIVSAPGHTSKVSALVGVPPEVTDLNLALEPFDQPNKVYLPLMRK